MTTPMIILAILFTPFFCGLIIERMTRKTGAAKLGGTYGFALAFSFFAVGHFVKTEPMMQMLPDFVPMKQALIYATGVLEALIAVALVWPATRRLAGWAALLVLIGFFPANIYAALNHTGMGGHQWGPIYLTIRAPLQILLITWGWWFTIRSSQRG